jgi:predicted transcriptional regulator
VFVGYVMMAYGFVQILTTGILNGFWLILIGNFLTSSARNSYNQTRNEIILSNINVKEMLSTPNLAIPFHTSADIALIDYFYPYKKSYFPVNQGFEIVGMVHIRDIKKIPINQRAEINVGKIMKKITDFPSIDDKKSGKIALQRLSMITEDPVLLVVKDSESERFIGFIGKNELISSLKFWSIHMSNTDLEIKK